MLEFIKRLFGASEEQYDPMKYLIVGIGNIGAKYEGTRHNIGFDAVDRLADDFNASFKTETLGDIAEFRTRGRTFVLLKPSTYVNLSGKAVRYWMQKKKIDKSNLLVIVDDMNLDFGAIRMRGKGSDGGHNGLKDINQMIGNTYARLRLGIGNAPKGKHVDFVLGKWDEEEQRKLPELLDQATKAVISFATAGLANTMNTFNRDPDQTKS